MKSLKWILGLVLAACSPILAFGQSNTSYVAGERVAQQFAYGYGAVNGASVALGNAATGTQTVTVCPAFRTTADGRQVQIFSATPPTPVAFDVGFATAETVTPTSVSILAPGAVQGVGADQSCASITGTFNQLHGASQNVYQVRSGTFGLQEAINDAGRAGGAVMVGTDWGGTSATLAAAAPFPGVAIIDKRTGTPAYWAPLGGATTLAAPATLTALTALPSATPVGTFTATNYNTCIAYVDILGQEGPCSTSFVDAGVATGSFIYSAPAASPGAVGYTIYIGLTGAGSTTLQYKVPLVTQPSVSGAYPVSNGVCTLTNVETITPACSLANSTYGTTGAVATVSAITVNTSPIQPTSTATSTTSIYIPNPGGRTTYTYAPVSSIGALTVTTPNQLAFTIGAAAATTVPNVVGTINLAPNAMNVVGKRLRVCGELTTTASTATIVDIQFQWDAMGQNTAGKGVLIGDLTATPAAAIATAGHATFCQDFLTTVASASATGGSINHVNGFGSVGGVSLIAPGALSDSVTPGAVGSLNLAVDSRINIIYLHTTGTDGAGWTLQNVSVQLI